VCKHGTTMLAGTRPARRPRGSTFLSLTAAVAVATVLLARTASGCPTTSAVSGLDGTAYACSESDGNECTLTPGSLIDLTVTFSKESVGSAYNLQETHPEPVAMVAPCSSGVHHNVDERGLRKRSLRLLKMVENGPQERTRANCRVHLDKATRYRSAALRTQQEPASAPGVPPTSALFIVAASSAWNKFRAGESKFCWWLIFFFVHPGFAICETIEEMYSIYRHISSFFGTLAFDPQCRKLMERGLVLTSQRRCATSWSPRVFSRKSQHLSGSFCGHLASFIFASRILCLLPQNPACLPV